MKILKTIKYVVAESISFVLFCTGALIVLIIAGLSWLFEEDKEYAQKD